MRDAIIILGACIASIAIGAGLFFFLPEQVPHTPPAVYDQTADAATAVSTPQDIGFVVIDSGTNAQVGERKNYAARDSESLLLLWRMAHGEDGTTPPAIDFTESYVIGVFAGTKSSGGHAIEVASVVEEGDVRTIVVDLVEPGAACVVTQALTNPYQLIVVPVSMARLASDDRTAITDCR